jgi:hypothetical protein
MQLGRPALYLTFFNECGIIFNLLAFHYINQNMKKDRPEDAEPTGTDTREVPPEARATNPEFAAASGVERTRKAALEESRRRLTESIHASSGPSRRREVSERICLYHNLTHRRLLNQDDIIVQSMGSGGTGETFMVLKCKKLKTNYVYCVKGGRPGLNLLHRKIGALLKEAPDVSILYQIKRDGILREIHRWEDEE